MDFGFFLSKLLPLFVYPLGLGLLLAILALLLMLARRHRLAFLTLLLGVVLVFASSTEMAAFRLLAPLEQQYPAVAIKDAPVADAIVVLGGGVDAAKPPRQFPTLGADGYRVLHAARLYRAARAPLVIVAGGSAFDKERSHLESAAARDFLIEFGVNSGAIVMEGTSRNTYENAVETSKILKSKGLRRVLLVTSAYHMPRAMASFHSQDIDAIAQPANFVVASDNEPALLAWIPKAFRLEQTHLALKEYLGFFVYRWRTWISEDYGFTPNRGG